jgi:hypothetical protein
LIDQKSLSQSYKNLKKKFQNNIETSTTLDEFSETIFSNKWIRIFLIGDLRTNQIHLQLEISPKDEFHTLSTSASNFKNDGEKTSFLRDFLANQIKSLQHLLKLTDIGFSLEFIREEGIWFGTKILEDEPTEELCKLITPYKKMKSDFNE